jgi:hypothetical protein
MPGCFRIQGKRVLGDDETIQEAKCFDGILG